VLCFSPPEQYLEFAAIAGEWWQCQPQAEGDLGVRMAAFFEEAFAAGMERAVLIGSDSPTLPLSYLHAAFAALQTHDAVLGKATDGGYYLIGLVRPCPDLFTDIAWSTPAVWQQTTSRLDQLGASWQALDTWSDFDDLKSLHALRKELANMQPLPGVYASLAGAIERAFAAASTLGRNSDEA
jgi:rSAM/selenodomain-associated transferase 1